MIVAVAAATLPAMAIDAPILRRMKGRWAFPSGALLTGLIVAMILNPHSPWYVVAVTSIVGVLSKYLMRGHTANVFNPAALALVATFYVFNTAQSWWGALPEMPPAALIVLLATGVFITYKVNKIPAVLAFLGVYYLFATTAAFVGNPAQVAESVPRSGSTRGALLRVLHGDRPADVAPQESRPDHLRRDHRRGGVRRVRPDRRGVLPPRGAARRERVGGLATPARASLTGSREPVALRATPSASTRSLRRTRREYRSSRAC